MRNSVYAKMMRIGMIDPKLSLPNFFELDLGNVMHTIRLERIRYMQNFMEAGPFRRQPIVNIIFELPDNHWKYVHSWIRKEDGTRKILELSKEAMECPREIIQEIMRTWIECEKVWAQHIENKIVAFEESQPQEHYDYQRVIQLVRR